jgi:hypothetical protein
MAERGGGESWFLSSAPDAEDITDAVDRVTASFAAPSVGDLVLEAPAGGAVGRVVARAGGIGVAVGALPAGGVRVLAGWADAEPAGFRVTGGSRVELSVAVAREPAVNALVAAARIRILEQAAGLAAVSADGALVRREASRAGIDPAALPASGAVYPRGRRTDATPDPLEAALAAEVVRLSRDGRVLSSRTAFVGVRTKAGRRSAGQVEIPSMLPDGWEGAAAAGPVRAGMLRSAPPPSPVAIPSLNDAPVPMGMLSFDAGIVSEATRPGRSLLRRVSGALGGVPSTRVDQVAPTPPVILRLAVAELLVGVDRPAPAGRWSVVRVTGTVAGGVAGAWLVIWTTDRTRPLLRARLADLLSAGERPASLDFAPGTVMHLAIEGGSLDGGDLVIELAA